MEGSGRNWIRIHDTGYNIPYIYYVIINQERSYIENFLSIKGSGKNFTCYLFSRCVRIRRCIEESSQTHPLKAKFWYKKNARKLPVLSSASKCQVKERLAGLASISQARSTLSCTDMKTVLRSLSISLQRGVNQTSRLSVSDWPRPFDHEVQGVGHEKK